VNPGDVVWIEFPGAVQTKRRPAIVLSTPAYHTARPDIIVGLVTSQIAKAVAPTDHVLYDWQAAGLRVPSAFRAFIVTLPRSSVVTSMGSLSSQDWVEVVARLGIAMKLN
jgi:mRNA interferase MazF